MGLASAIRGLARGATRGVMNSKQGNKNFYKGTGSGRMGRWTARGRFLLEPWRFRSWEIPELSNCELKPFVSKNADKHFRQSHSFRDYFNEDNVPQEMDLQFAERCRKRAENIHAEMVKPRPRS
ncbi:mitochondrial ribosomal protein L27-domain-containing protein [Phlyctochytrium arcticum]|nr:mitochondrial ribosomal protein L27-domain-containing protein [Phlyctochytrium arcticum]